jgi:hypothetical protein
MKNSYKTDTYNKKAIYAPLDQFCVFAKQSNRGEFIEVTEWKNGEGFDVHISNVQGVVDFRLTHGEFDALKKIVKKLNKNENS